MNLERTMSPERLFRKRKSVKLGEYSETYARVRREPEFIEIQEATMRALLTVPEARALRDWLDKVLPEEKE